MAAAMQAAVSLLERQPRKTRSRVICSVQNELLRMSGQARRNTSRPPPGPRHAMRPSFSATPRKPFYEDTLTGLRFAENLSPPRLNASARRGRTLGQSGESLEGQV